MEHLEGTSIPQPSEVASVLRELAPGLCAKFDTLSAFQEYVWTNENLKEVRVRPRHEAFARMWCNPPPRQMWGNVIKSPSFVLYVDHTMPEYEMHLVYTDGSRAVIELERE